MRVSIELDRQHAVRPLAIVGDLLLLLGFAAVIYGLARYSLALAFIVGGVVLFLAGAACTALAMSAGRGIPGKHGPFERSTASEGS